MKRRIFEAATSVISSHGYHRASIIQVVREAGISLGALQHHFKTKDDLVAETAEHLLNRSVKWFVRAKEELKRGRNAFAEVMFRSWEEQFQTEEYGALLEIMVAARTDEDLRARIAPALANWRDAIERELASLLPKDFTVQQLESALTISRCLMTGLLVHDGLLRDHTRMRFVLAEWLRMVSAK